MAEGLEERARQLAQLFHETYERLAPQFGYETRRESAKPWAEVPEQNRNLMIAVCKEVGEQVRRETMEQDAQIVESYTGAYWGGGTGGQWTCLEKLAEAIRSRMEAENG